MNGSYDYYRAFYYAAKYGSITRAAHALLNNQPNVTRMVKALESELGCVLLQRSNRGVRLTPEGEALYAHVAAAMEHLEQGENELLAQRGLRQGTVSVGVSETALRCFLLPVLKTFRRTHPAIRIRVSNHATAQALQALREGLVDFAVVTTPLELPSGAESCVLRRFQEIPVCGGDLTHLAARQRTLEELCDHPLVGLGRSTMTYRFYSEWFFSQGLHYAPDIETAAADQILPMIQAGLGVGFVPEDFLSADGGVFPISLTQSAPMRTICLVHRTDRQNLRIAALELERALLSARAPEASVGQK